MKKLLLIVFTLGILHSFFKNFAQNTELSEYDELPVKADCQYLKSYFNDTKDIIISPTKWKHKEWFVAAICASTTLILYSEVDERMRKWSQNSRLHTDASDKISATFERIGHGSFPVITMPLLYTYGAVTKHDKPKRVALLAIEAYLITGAIVQIPKYLLGRHRPHANDGHDAWDGFGLSFSNRKNSSFYSGHAGTAFSLATVFALEYSEYKFVPPLAYSIATLASLSRVYDDAHWTSDIFVGAVLGYAMTKLIVENHRKKKIDISFSNFRNVNQLNITYKF